MQAYPHTAAREYQRALSHWVAMMGAVTAAKVAPALLRLRVDDDDVDAIMREVNGARVAWEGTIGRGKVRPGLIAQGAAHNVEEFNRHAMNNQFRAVVPVDVIKRGATPATDDAMLQFTRINAGLITTVSDRYFGDIEAMVSDAVISGGRPEDVQALLEDRLGVAQSNAARIARDQVNKLNGQLTEMRQRELGIDGYTWRTSNDERVRGRPGGKYPKATPSHWALDGKSFKWSHPPASGTDGEPGHPGTAIECRCNAEPDIEGVLSALELS